MRCISLAFRLIDVIAIQGKPQIGGCFRNQILSACIKAAIYRKHKKPGLISLTVQKPGRADVRYCNATVRTVPFKTTVTQASCGRGAIVESRVE